MGYDLHITRSKDWSDNRGLEIDSAEWLACVAGDSELVPDPTNGPFAVRWSSTWFDWYEGNVFTTDPDPVTVRKMLRLAETLEAMVQGDDGEFYENESQWASRGNASAGTPRRGD